MIQCALASSEFVHVSRVEVEEEGLWRFDRFLWPIECIIKVLKAIDDFVILFFIFFYKIYFSLIIGILFFQMTN